MLRTTWSKTKIMQGVILDKFSAFDKACISRLLAKLEQLKWNLAYKLVRSVLGNRCQNSVIDGPKSTKKG